MAAAKVSKKANFSHVLERQRSHSDANDRITVNLPKFFERAKELRGRQEIDIKEIWPYIAWSCDVALHILDNVSTQHLLVSTV